MSKWKVLGGVDYGRDLDAHINGAPNFQYGEVVESSVAVAHAIANVPTEAQWIAAEQYAMFILQPLRNRKGRIRMASWFRCHELNSHPDIGSTDASFHCTGGGGDLKPQDCSLMELLEEAYTLHFSEIIAEWFPNGWVHIGFLRGDDRRRLKLKDVTHNYARITIEELRKLYHKGT